MIGQVLSDFASMMRPSIVGESVRDFRATVDVIVVLIEASYHGPVGPQ